MVPAPAGSSEPSRLPGPVLPTQSCRQNLRTWRLAPRAVFTATLDVGPGVHLAWRLTPGCLHNRVPWKGFGWSVAGRDCPLLRELRWQGSPSIHLVGGCNAGRLPRAPPQPPPVDLLPSLLVLLRQCHRQNRNPGCLYHSQTGVQHQVRKEREVAGGRGRTAKPKASSPLFSPQDAQPLSGMLFF